jgi:hypothetical protein
VLRVGSSFASKNRCHVDIHVILGIHGLTPNVKWQVPTSMFPTVEITQVDVPLVTWDLGHVWTSMCRQIEASLTIHMECHSIRVEASHTFDNSDFKTEFGMPSERILASIGMCPTSRSLVLRLVLVLLTLSYGKRPRDGLWYEPKFGNQRPHMVLVTRSTSGCGCKWLLM